MTRDEAIAYWKQRSEHIHNWLEENKDADFVGEYVEAIDMAIESLSAEEEKENGTFVNRDNCTFNCNDSNRTLVDVVRCKDCKHWTEEKDEEDDILYGWCRAPFENDNLLVYGDDATRIFTVYDFFCKSGKRREHEKSEAKET